MLEFPPPHIYQDTAILLISHKINRHNRVTVYSLSTESTTNNTFIRIVNEDLFKQNVQLHDQIGFRITEDIHNPELITHY